MAVGALECFDDTRGLQVVDFCVAAFRPQAQIRGAGKGRSPSRRQDEARASRPQHGSPRNKPSRVTSKNAGVANYKARLRIETRQVAQVEALN